MTTRYRIPRWVGLGAVAGLLSLALCAALVLALDPVPSFWVQDHSPFTLFGAAAMAGAVVALGASIIKRDRRSAVVGLAFGAVVLAVAVIGSSPDSLLAALHHGPALSATAFPVVGGALIVERGTRA